MEQYKKMDKSRYSCENDYFEFLNNGETQENYDDIRRKRISELFKKQDSILIIDNIQK